MMRYQQLNIARETLINAFAYVMHNYPSTQAKIEALQILLAARRDVKDELKHPERFNVDGSRRLVSVVVQNG